MTEKAKIVSKTIMRFVGNGSADAYVDEDGDLILEDGDDTTRVVFKADLPLFRDFLNAVLPDPTQKGCNDEKQPEKVVALSDDERKELEALRGFHSDIWSKVHCGCAFKSAHELVKGIETAMNRLDADKGK